LSTMFETCAHICSNIIPYWRKYILLYFPPYA
jgi:hypothetical protein